MSKKQVTVLSSKSVQSGQKHRSSINFTTESFGKNCSLIIRAYYDYGTTDQREAKDVSFDIKVDKTGTDSTWKENIKSGYCCNNTNDRNLYIANPVNAKQDFMVVIESGITIKSSSKPLDGEKHRSSENFSTTGFSDKAKIKFTAFYDYGTENVTPATGIRFNIKQDKKATKDPVIWTDIAFGDTKENKPESKLYIADPSDTDKSFVVVIEEE